jgi:hypothetical protein
MTIFSQKLKKRWILILKREKALDLVKKSEKALYYHYEKVISLQNCIDYQALILKNVNNQNDSKQLFCYQSKIHN